MTASRAGEAARRIRLFCFPYAGGGASVFHSWSRELPAAIEAHPVRLPGREARWIDPPFTRLSALVEHLANELEPHLGAPYAFFGHSMGALIAFELARELRRRTGAVPSHLLVSGARAPQRPDPFRSAHQLPDLELVQKLRWLEGTPDEVLANDELMQLVLPAVRADFAMCDAHVHVPGPPLDCPISAYGGARDRRIGFSDLAAWRFQTREAFTLQLFPGNHFFLHTARTALLTAVARDLGWSRARAT
jgi:medium-chain acyl-[acyl-carrier-protein] hydrolase